MTKNGFYGDDETRKKAGEYKMNCPMCKKGFERADLNIWGRRFCPYCNYDLDLEDR